MASCYQKISKQTTVLFHIFCIINSNNYDLATCIVILVILINFKEHEFIVLVSQYKRVSKAMKNYFSSSYHILHTSISFDIIWVNVDIERLMNDNDMNFILLSFYSRVENYYNYAFSIIISLPNM